MIRSILFCLLISKMILCGDVTALQRITDAENKFSKMVIKDFNGKNVTVQWMLFSSEDRDRRAYTSDISQEEAAELWVKFRYARKLGSKKQKDDSLVQLALRASFTVKLKSSGYQHLAKQFFMEKKKTSGRKAKKKK